MHLMMQEASYDLLMMQEEYNGEKPEAFHHFFVGQSRETVQNPTEYDESLPKIFENEACFLKNVNQASNEKWKGVERRADVNPSRTIKVSILAVFVEIFGRKS
ncbi:hypothetical protein Y032_0117g659 [Ancylostoma ceylanicum]|uniref:Uncharacterized protein n=2 Tax=Ancylostoma ceylanicum TaxID=53326 RepID=A0A016TC41_9BILA|nr:hypothetical protein Y032_0117g659 [Ancylostoma ceylanicum]